MRFIKKLFRRKEGDASSKASGKNDEMGALEFTEGDWTRHLTSAKKSPYVVYEFKTKKDVRAAILELPDTHKEAITGKLVYKNVVLILTNSGKYETILFRFDLAEDVWLQAKESFVRHGGLPLKEG